MLVGAAQTDITPAPGLDLCGFVARVQPSTGVHDALLARALYVETESARLLWLHADLIGFARDFVLDTKNALREQLGLAPHEIVLSATHTHSGPATATLLNCGRADPAYAAGLQEHLLEAATRALNEKQPADLLVGETRHDLGVDRRGKPHKHTDPRVGVLAWRRPEGAYAAVLANYGLHNVALGHENRLISADMAGAAARRITAQLPGGPVVLFTNGGAGNVNPPAVTNDFARMEQWGSDLGDAAVSALTAASHAPRPVVRAASQTIDLPLVRLTPDEINASADRHRGYSAGKTDYVSLRCRDAFDQWQKHMTERVAHEPHPTAPLDVQIIALGPVVFAAFAAEMFSLTADDLRAATGRTVYAVSYANGVIGYLPPPYAAEEGGYEVDGAHLFYDQLPLAPGAYEQARDAALDLIRAL